MYINKDIVMTIKFMPQFEMHTACKVPSHMVPHLIDHALVCHRWVTGVTLAPSVQREKAWGSWTPAQGCRPCTASSTYPSVSRKR